MRRRDWLGLMGSALLGRRALARAAAGAGAPEAARNMPEGVMPTLGCWFWIGEEAFVPGAYRKFLDAAAEHSAYDLLTTSLRAPGAEITRPEVHERLRQAALYARERGLGIVLDLDVRLARRAFQEQYPDELQEMLRLREFESGAAEARIASEVLHDHYTGGGAEPYLPLSGRFLRCYAYQRGAEGVEPATLEELTAACEVLEASAEAVRVRLPVERIGARTACVMAAFTHLAADVFAPHILAFQRHLLELYADVPLAGACKDEWGFPPCYNGCPEHNDFWYSEAYRRAYAEATDGRDLVRDCLLMYAGERGREGERQAAINRFLGTSRKRNAGIERDFYRATKEVFGPHAVPATHPTWYPYPGVEEFKKNGLDWWQAPRDWAQTDEVTPYCARTALAKKWGSPVWYNMYYSPHKADYERGIWSYVLAGGRMNCHPLYPLPGGSDHYDLLRGGLMRGIARIRLLGFISHSPLDCPVAVVFGHACAMNWAGPHYGDTGVDLADALWRAGFPADLIPTSEIEDGALRIGRDGAARYGAQRYAALVLYHPEFERPSTAAFVRRAARGGRTLLLRMGEWTRDFVGRPFDGATALAHTESMTDLDACSARVGAHLQAQGIAPETPAGATVAGFGRRMASPPSAGSCRLIDGTHILVAGAERAEGDPIVGGIELGGRRLEVDAEGLVAVRFGRTGRLEALAAGGLKRLECGEFRLELTDRVDLALWTDADGRRRGVVQDLAGALPPALAKLAQSWTYLRSPAPLG